MARVGTHDSFLPPLWILTIVAALTVAWLLVTLKELLVLLVIGYCIAYLMQPLIARLARRRVPPAIGFFIITAAVVLLMVVLAVTAIPTLLREYHRLVENLPMYLDVVEQRLSPYLGEFLELAPPLFEEGQVLPFALLGQVDGAAVQTVLAGIGRALLQGYSITLAVLNVLLLPFIAFYLTIDFHAFHQRIVMLFPLRQRERVVAIAREIDGYVSAFVRGQFLVCSILFLLYAIGLAIVGVELWFLLAFIAGFGNLIPYIGFLIGIVLSSIMALVTFGDLWHLLQVWLVFGVVQFFEGMIITPSVVGDRVGLSPLAVLVALIVGGQLFGLLGVFLAVPAAAALKVLGRYLHGWVLARAQA